MSSLLVVRPQEALWMVQSGAHEETLDSLANALDGDDPTLATAMREGREDMVFHLEDLTPERFARVVRAARRIWDRVADLDRIDEERTGYLSVLSELVALLRDDPRAAAAGESPPAVGTLEVARGSTWQADGLVYDFVVEQLATRLLVEQGLIARMLLLGRDERFASLIHVPPSRMARVRDAVDWVVDRFGNGHGAGAVDDHFFSRLVDPLRSLRALFV